MRYDLGFMDMYLVEAAGSTIENNPMYKITFKTKVDPVKLEDAVYRAIKFHPLFGTQVRYDKVYYLQTNNRPIVLVHADVNNRPKNFGTGTNGYPWQICWNDRVMTFEWCHCITDGRGTIEFLKTLLSIYCGVTFPVVPRKINLGLGWEPFADKNSKGKGVPVHPSGFRRKALPAHRRGYKCDCHVLSANTSEILALSKKCDSSPSVILTALISKAIRMHLPESAKNRNVANNVVIDLRKPLQYDTMHNCDDFLRITYQDKHDEMSFTEVCRDFKNYLDEARSHENMIRMITERVDLLKLVHSLPTKWMRRGFVHMYGIVEKDLDCNTQITYVGRAEFPDKVNAQVEDFQFRSWPDFGECTIAAVDFNGTFKINICENYIENGIVEDFIKLCAEQGIYWNYLESSVFEQAHFEEEKKKVRSKGNTRTEEHAIHERRSLMPEPLSSPTIFL